MKSRTSYFNKTLFLKNFTRFWPIWTLYLVIWTLIMPIPMMNAFDSYYRSGMRMTEIVLEYATYGGLIISAMFCAVAAALVFMFAYNARSTNFVASLPLSRECVFITSYLSGLCWFIVSNVIVFLLSLLAQAGARNVDPAGLLQWLAIVSLFNLIFYSISVICVIIAGNIVGAGLLYAAANGGLIVTEVLVRMISSEYIKGLTFFNDFDEAITRFLTPVIQLWGKVESTYAQVDLGDYVDWTVTSVKYTGWTSLLLYALAGVILSVIALWLYRRRHMETASDLISVKPLRPVFKYLVTFFCALTLGMLIFAIIFAISAPKLSQIPLTICMIFGGAVGYFGSEMLLHKSFRVFKSWKGFAVCALVIVILMTCISIDVLGISKRVPDPDNVESVSIYMSAMYDATDFDETEDIKTVTQIHRLLIGKEYTAPMGGDGDFLSDNVYNTYSTTITLTYTMKNGSTMVRRYYANMPKSSELYKLVDGILNTREAILNRITPSIPVTPNTRISGEIYGTIKFGDDDYRYRNLYLEGQQARELYESCIVPDAMDGNIGRISADGYDYYGNDYDYDVTVYLSFDNTTTVDGLVIGSEGDDMHLQIPASAARTMDYIKKLVETGEYGEYGNYFSGYDNEGV